MQEKDLASKKYFEKLIDSQKTNPNANSNQSKKDAMEIEIPKGNSIKELSPVEQIFHKHMKKSLSSFEDFYKELSAKYYKSIENLKAESVKKMSEIQATDAKTKEQQDADIAVIVAQCEGKQKELDDSFQESVKLLVEAFDGYLSTTIPAPSFLPISVSVHIPSKNIKYQKIVLKPTDSSVDLKATIQKKFLESGQEFVEWGKNLQILIERVFESDEPKSEMILDLPNFQQIKVIDEHRPLTQYKLHQGDRIIFTGEVHFKSDMPKQCFSILYDKNKDMTMDYYTCKDCKFNWICKACAETCHKGHQITEYISKHRPTWACCYCVKNKKCALVSKPPT